MIGQTIAHYKVTAKLGAGGMGEVYRATDTKLGREVALKVLPLEFAQDAQRMARFQREAQVLASLNHPNIAAIYGIEGSDVGASFSSPASGPAQAGPYKAIALAMELVEGPTLAERIAQGPIPMDEALPIARQITEALEYAHEHNIIHRDLKPANIKLTPDGNVKVLDFGLAKALSDEPGPQDISDSPTLSLAATKAGIILGTAAYMSPEQARGKTVNRRTDIWSFGVVLFEMLTGKQAFAGETTPDATAAILRGEPRWHELPQELPPKVEYLLRRCLQKQEKQRLRDIGEARVLLEATAQEPTGTAPLTAAASGGWPRLLPWVVASVLAAISAGLAWKLWVSSATPPQPGVRSSIPFPAKAPGFTLGTLMDISPDGSRLALVALNSDETQLYIRRLDQIQWGLIPGTSGASSPFFSPDGQWVAFFAEGKLKKVSVNGGPPFTLCEAAGNLGGSWGADDTIVFSASGNGGLLRVSAAGGAPEQITKPDTAQGDLAHLWPRHLTDGKAVFFTSERGEVEGSSIEAYIPATGQRKKLIGRASQPRYTPTGHLVFNREGTLMAAPFDADRMEVTGPASPVIESVLTEFTLGQFSISNNGLLVYVPGGALIDYTIVQADRKGTIRRLTKFWRGFEDMNLSPDGRRVAFTLEEETADIWVYDIGRDTLTRLTFEPPNRDPVWSSDGQRIFYYSLKNGKHGLYSRPADGGGSEVELFSTSKFVDPGSASHDGKLFLFAVTNPNTGEDLWVLPLEGDRKPRPFLQDPFSQNYPRFSPDDRWVAYVSNETGRQEVFLQAFPSGGAKLQISTEGGVQPIWSRSGRELFYRQGAKIMSVSLTMNPTPSASKPVPFFSLASRASLRSYDITPDAQHFILIQPSERLAAPTELHLVVGWFEELKRRVPAGKN